MTQIHHTAIVDPAAQLQNNVTVGPYSIIGPNVTIANNTTIANHVIIEGHTTLGQNNHVSHHATLGQKPQDLKYNDETTTLIIGDNNDIRENVTMHVGTANGGWSTTVGSNNLFMVGSHIAHDSHVANHCILANNVLLAGHVIIADHAVVGGGSAITQYVRIGQYAYIGGLSGVVHDCPPFLISDGHPAFARGVNLIGLTRNNLDHQSIERLKTAYMSLYKRDNTSISQASQQLIQQFPDDKYIKYLCQFITETAATPNGRFTETTRLDDKRLTRPQ